MQNRRHPFVLRAPMFSHGLCRGLRPCTTSTTTCLLVVTEVVGEGRRHVDLPAECLAAQDRVLRPGLQHKHLRNVE